jgi:hypothetical protein
MSANAKSPNILLGNSMIKNTASAATNVGKNTASVINNVGKNTVSAVSNAGTAIANAGTSAVNTMANAGNSVVNTVANAGNSVVNTMANSFKSVQANTANTVNTMANSIQESIEAVPSTAPDLSISMPLILGIGALMIALALILYYKATIQSGVMNAYKSLKNMFTPGPEPIPEPPSPDNMNTVNRIVPARKTVFNVNSNKYIYSDAEPLCKALGAELATYDQVKQAWDQGADWCNYGWIKGQAAVYPTQKSTYDALQQSSVDDERMACGNIGVNGGYMDNPELRYGVNCYGDKPSQTDHDLKVTNELIQPPLTPSALKQKVVELGFKANSNLIGLLPFNESSW